VVDVARKKEIAEYVVPEDAFALIHRECSVAQAAQVRIHGQNKNSRRETIR